MAISQIFYTRVSWETPDKVKSKETLLMQTTGSAESPDRMKDSNLVGFFCTLSVHYATYETAPLRQGKHFIMAFK